MPYEANVTDVAYRYDGSFAGFLCCVFESYARHEIPSEVCSPEEGQLNLFGTREILTAASAYPAMKNSSAVTSRASRSCRGC